MKTKKAILSAMITELQKLIKQNKAGLPE